MTDFPLLVPRRDTQKRRDGVSLVRGVLAAIVQFVERRRARRAMLLPLKHMSDAQLRDIGLSRCGTRCYENL